MTTTPNFNELQERANVIQEKLKEVIRKYNIIMVFLTIIIIVLTAATLSNKTGRYAISTVDATGVYVLDTKTSQLWCRTMNGSSYCLGTNKKPEGIRQINK